MSTRGLAINENRNDVIRLTLRQGLNERLLQRRARAPSIGQRCLLRPVAPQGLAVLLHSP